MVLVRQRSPDHTAGGNRVQAKLMPRNLEMPEGLPARWSSPLARGPPSAEQRKDRQMAGGPLGEVMQAESPPYLGQRFSWPHFWTQGEKGKEVVLGLRTQFFFQFLLI